MARVRVLIADAHPSTRAGVRRTLEAAGFKVCGEAADGHGAVKAARSERPDLCLLAVDMPGDSIEAITTIQTHSPKCAVVLFAASSDERQLIAAIRAGASGYLLKDMDPERLPAALEGVLRGEAAVPRGLMARLLDDYRRLDARRRLPIPGRAEVELTQREWEILEPLRRGEPTASIAKSLSISPVTVRRHISGLLGKLGVASREDAVRLLDGTAERPLR